MNFSLTRSWIDEKILVYVVKCGAHCIITTLIRTLALIFDEIRSLCKWKLELMKVMRCLNRSWIHNSYCLLLFSPKFVFPIGFSLYLTLLAPVNSCELHNYYLVLSFLLMYSSSGLSTDVFFLIKQI